AASGAVAHDLMYSLARYSGRGQGEGSSADADSFVGTEGPSPQPSPGVPGEGEKVRAAKWTAIFVGIIAMGLGVLFEKMNVSFLVGWAFNVAASANLPALVMLLFWKHTTRQGIVASIWIGLISSLGWLLLSAPAFKDVYGL